MKLNVNNIVAKIAQNSGKIGAAYGYLGPMAARAAQQGYDPLNYIIGVHERAFDAVLSGKLPKPKNILEWLKSPSVKPILKNALIAYIVGELGGGFIGGRNAKALKTFAVETAKMTVVSAAVTTIHWNPHPPSDVMNEVHMYNRVVGGNATNPFLGVYG